uniref:Sortase n=1 Tax=candidate division WWE3 bacterium TaxID=2053526 RepID=A0A7C4XTH6_UNCKA
MIATHNKLFGILLIFVSLFFFGKMVSKIIERYKTVPLQGLYQNQTNTLDEGQSNLLPVTIEIPNLQIQLPVNYSTIEKGEWVFEGEGAFYLTQSPIPGERGNSIIFGHNFPNAFGKLKSAKKGDLIDITLKNGTKRSFKVEYTQNISPDQTYVLDQTDDTRISIYTCSGFMDLKRLLVVATPAI